MERIPYKVKMLHCSTPCPHGMKATCTQCEMKAPTLVHVGSELEKACPYFVSDDNDKHIVTCEFIPNSVMLYDYK